MREKGLVSSLAHETAGIVVGAALRTYNRLTVIGADRLPTRPPFVLVANHTSHLDALILAATLSREARDSAYCVAAGDAFFESVGVAAATTILFNALPLWRKKVTSHTLQGLRERLESGHTGLIIFPEGARSRDGLPLRFKPGVGMLVSESSIPVYPCHIDGAFQALAPGVRMPRPVRITVRVGTPLTFQSLHNSREGWNQVANQIRESVAVLSPHPWPIVE
ncbi:MAG: 1-acyl-sn-glycerol-3-phosphate acyltransferase [Phycisphaerales bacterium]|nr:MAG: 1-acyl-sn-glycerol-3-phosphate acyltransferase [Phycisphaerales bacterium]